AGRAVRRGQPFRMNLLLLEEQDFIAPERVRLSGRRLQHMLQVHQVQRGTSLRVGQVDGLMGEGRVLELSDTKAELEVCLSEPPPFKLPLTLLLAMPRPKMFRRILRSEERRAGKEWRSR